MAVAPRERAGDEELPATAWTVLGLLSFGQALSGYELKKWADAILPLFYWSPAVSHIYAELKRLEKRGYVASQVVDRRDVRPKRVYAITSAGRRALTRWVRHAPVDPPILKHSVALRVWLGHLAEPDHLREVVEQHRAYAEEMREHAASSRAAIVDRADRRFPAVVLAWFERYYASERDLADSVLADLEALARDQAPRRKGQVGLSRPAASRARP